MKKPSKGKPEPVVAEHVMMKDMVQTLSDQWLLYLHAVIAIEMNNRAVKTLAPRKGAKKIMGRAQWSPADMHWLAEHPHGLPPDSPYRLAYRQKILGGSKTFTKVPEPWKDLPLATVERWRARNLPERWATSDKTAQALAWLEEEFGGLRDPEGV